MLELGPPAANVTARPGSAWRDNGLHTVHHLKAGAHWSTLPELHAEIEHEIHPDLVIENFGLWFVKVYFASIVLPEYGTQQIGRAPDDPPNAGEESNLPLGEPA